MSEQFHSAKTPSGKTAFEAYCAIWQNKGKNVALAAPTIEALGEVWRQITGTNLDQAAAQHVWIVRFV